MMRHVTSALLTTIAVLSPSAPGQTVMIVESKSYIGGHDMDTEWQNVVLQAGGTPTIVPQTALDSTTFFSTTDILVVSSGVIDLPANRTQTIQSFLTQGGKVYLQGEYLTTYTSNQAFSTIINALGGSFTWGATIAGDLIPMAVTGTLSTTPHSVPSLGYFWYGANGTGDQTVTPFLTYAGNELGWVFDPPGSAGRMIQTTDQDWVRTTTSPQLMENILVELGAASNPCAPTYGTGCPGTGGFAPTFFVTGCPTAASVITLSIEDGLGGSSALLLLGTQQAALPIGAGCTLNVAPLFPFTIGPIPLGGTGAGQGSFLLPATIPPGVPPGSLTIQAIVGDAASPLGFSMSNGVELIFP